MRTRSTFVAVVLEAILAQVALAGGLKADNLQCEYLTAPEGIDASSPRLSWSPATTPTAERGQRQTAYQVLVAGTREALAADQGDLWDSGKVASDRCFGIVYAGKMLPSHQRCFWKVRVWDKGGQPSDWSQPALWSMGILDPAEWAGKWLRHIEPSSDTRPPPRPFNENVRWIWYPEGNPAQTAPAGQCYLRRIIDLPATAKVREATVTMTADNLFTLYVNGKQAGHSKGPEDWRIAQRIDVSAMLTPGRNAIAVQAENVGVGPAGLAAEIEILADNATGVNLVTDDSWLVSKDAAPGWEQPDFDDSKWSQAFDDSKWSHAKVAAAMGDAPWGIVYTGDPRAWLQKHASPVFRKTFTVKQAPARATISICGLGYYELRLNGRKVGDRVLDPLFTRYDRRVLYTTYDVTSQLVQGANALGVMLGNGFYNSHTRDAWDFDQTPWRDEPTLLCQLRLEYPDGAAETIATDATWKASTGPVRHDGTRNGEDYDARRELPGWDTPDFDDAAWATPSVVAGPEGALRAAMAEPIRVVQTIAPVALTEPQPGVYVFDLGQNISGWAQLKVLGLAGTQITLRYAERVHPDGSLDQEGIAVHVHEGPFQTDRYTLKGGGEEIWEPRFTYHGFRWVEVTGFPGKPTLDNLRGRVVHTAFTPAGSFECSNPLLNKIQQATLWAYRGNFVGIPTDCPHREKNGWTGDAHLAAEQAMFNFQNVPGYEKWMNDFKDEQRPSGELPGIIPTGGWGYAWGNGPAWDSAYVLIPWYLYQYYGDIRILEEHYDRMRRYVNYLHGKSRGYIVNIGLGDWAPAETGTAVAVTSTGYFYVDAMIVSQVAALLGKNIDAKAYADLAAGIRQAFRKTFIKPDGRVSNGSQTALSCALFQGLAEPQEREAIFQQLVKNVEAHDGHLDTGILGAKYLFRTLSDYGRADLALRIAEQTSPPSYGSWIERGATTLWEDWDDGASRNHIMFGDISAWFYQYLAGINADPKQPAFKHIVLHPRPVGDLTFVKASHDSPYGGIKSEWKREGNKFTWNITIPPSTTATICVPADKRETVLEGDKPADQAPGVRFVRFENRAAQYEVDSGSYSFRSELPAE